MICELSNGVCQSIGCIIRIPSSIYRFQLIGYHIRTIHTANFLFAQRKAMVHGTQNTFSVTLIGCVPLKGFQGGIYEYTKTLASLSKAFIASNTIIVDCFVVPPTKLPLCLLWGRVSMNDHHHAAGSMLRGCVVFRSSVAELVFRKLSPDHLRLPFQFPYIDNKQKQTQNRRNR